MIGLDAMVAEHLRAEARGLMAFVRMLAGDREAAEDLFQETCLEAWRHRDRFAPELDFGAWLRGIARNVVRRHRRRAARSRERSSPLDPELFDPRRQTWSRDGLEERLAARRTALRGCLGGLEAGQRELLRRRYDERASHEELASETGRSADAVKMLFHRLRRKLLDCISRKLRREKIDAL